MESALQGDERCVLDTMRLVDLLLVLLFEGRKALPKSTAGSTGRIPGLRRLDSSGERSHRQLIDCIRSKDTDALIDAIDTGGKSNDVHAHSGDVCAQEWMWGQQCSMMTSNSKVSVYTQIAAAAQVYYRILKLHIA